MFFLFLSIVAHTNSHYIWDPDPQPGIEPWAPALGVRVPATGPLGSPHIDFLNPQTSSLRQTPLLVIFQNGLNEGLVNVGRIWLDSQIPPYTSRYCRTTGRIRKGPAGLRISILRITLLLSKQYYRKGVNTYSIRKYKTKTNCWL